MNRNDENLPAEQFTNKSTNKKACKRNSFESNYFRKPLSLEWISDDLLLDTQNVWTKVYNREVSKDEAIEILLNVKRLAKFLVKID